MKKKFLSLSLAVFMALSLTACGEPQKAESEKNVVKSQVSSIAEQGSDASSIISDLPETSSSSVVEESTPAETGDVTTGEVVEENGMRKVPVITDKALNRTGETGPFKYSVDAIQVSRLTATTDDTAELLGVEKDKEVTLVAISASVENTSDDTNYFYFDQATLTTNTKEQVDPDAFLSDYIDGEYLGNVVHSGTVLYILKNTSADDLSTITFHVDAPHNEDFDSIGDDVKIELNFE